LAPRSLGGKPNEANISNKTSTKRNRMAWNKKGPEGLKERNGHSLEKGWRRKQRRRTKTEILG